MRLMGLLFKVAVECFDVLAWPLFALGYPLCASIQAIETNSKLDTQKLITYWVCFCLILLYEHAFAKLLEWLPSWPYIKLVIVGCLILPHFDGSFYVYKKLVHPCLSVNPHSVLDWFIKLKEFLKQDNFLFEPKLGQAEVAKKESNAVVIMEKKEVTSTKQVRQIQPNFAPSGNRTRSSVYIKEMTEAMIAGRDLLDMLPSKKAQKDCTWDPCEVTTASETNVISHLQERQHEGACEKLEANNQTSSANNPFSVETSLPLESKEIGTATMAVRYSEEQHSKDVQKLWICSVCQETATNVTDFISHLQGKQHVGVYKKLKANGQTLTSKFSSASVIVSATPDSSCDLPEKLQSNSTQTPWTCAVCQVKVSSKMDLISHFQGRRHEEALEKLKVKIETSRSNVFPAVMEKEITGGDLPDKLHCKNVQIPWVCGICRTSIKDEASLVSHLQGRQHANACEKAKPLIQTSKNTRSKASKRT